MGRVVVFLHRERERMRERERRRGPSNWVTTGSSGKRAFLIHYPKTYTGREEHSQLKEVSSDDLHISPPSFFFSLSLFLEHRRRSFPFYVEYSTIEDGRVFSFFLLLGFFLVLPTECRPIGRLVVGSSIVLISYSFHSVLLTHTLVAYLPHSPPSPTHVFKAAVLRSKFSVEPKTVEATAILSSGKNIRSDIVYCLYI